MTPPNLPASRGARAYVIINGRLDAFMKIVAQTPQAVLSRSYSASAMNVSRRTAALSAEFAHRYDMRLRFTVLPMTFAYRARCARTSRRWAALSQAFDSGARADRELPRHPAACPALRAQPDR